MDARRATFFANIFGAPLEPVWITRTVAEQGTRANNINPYVQRAAIALPTGAEVTSATAPGSTYPDTGVQQRIRAQFPDLSRELENRYEGDVPNDFFLSTQKFVHQQFLGVYSRLIHAALSAPWPTGGDKSTSNIDAFLAKIRSHFLFFADKNVLYYFLKRAMDVREDAMKGFDGSLVNNKKFMHAMYVLQKIVVEANKTSTAGQLFGVLQGGLRMLRGGYRFVDIMGRDGSRIHEAGNPLVDILANDAYDGYVINKTFQACLAEVYPGLNATAIDQRTMTTQQNNAPIRWDSALAENAARAGGDDAALAFGGYVEPCIYSDDNTNVKFCTGLVGAGANMFRRLADATRGNLECTLNLGAVSQAQAGNTANVPRKRDATRLYGQPPFGARHGMHRGHKKKFNSNFDHDDDGGQGNKKSRFGRRPTNFAAPPVFGANVIHDAPETDEVRRDVHGRPVRRNDRDHTHADKNDASFDEKFDDAADETSDPLKRFIMQAIISTPVTHAALHGFVEENIPFPFGFMLMRPNATYLMGTGILTKGGASTGETLIGHTDFQLADNVVQKMHYGNFTMYLKSIVYKPDNVFLAENIFSGDYVDGLDTSMHDLRSVLSERTDNNKRSIYTCMVS
jgi:hypothetical protein